MSHFDNHRPTLAAWDERAALAADDAPECKHPICESDDVVDAIAQAVRLPRRFRRSGSRRSEPQAFTFQLDRLARPDSTLDIDVADAEWSFDVGDDASFELSNRMVFTPAAGYSARRGDVMLHGDAVAPALGSPNVSIGSRPALRTCDSHVCTSTTPTPHASAGFVATYEKVRINGFAALRVGDYVDEGPHGLNPITSGCRSVVIGPVPKPVECWRPCEAELPRPPERVPLRWHRGRSECADAKVVIGAELHGPLAQVDGMAPAVRLWAEAPTRPPADLQIACRPTQRLQPSTSDELP